jgi:aspartyl-tRNA(Asn)/glutamyl-tRNA(Gln) amidotransferase subunit A
VAAGFCAAALGTDTIGSVRIPASYCGVYGHKPGRGWISNRGVAPLSPSFDTIGVLARSAQDCLLLTNIMGAAGMGADGKPAFGRIAVLDWSGAVEVAPDVAAAFARAVEKAGRMGLHVERKRLDGFDYARIQRLLLLVAEVEGAKIHEEALLHSPEGFSSDLRRMLDWGRSQSPQKYADALRDIRAAADLVAHALSDCDALLCPATPQSAFRFGAVTPTNQAVFMTPAICTGFAATAFPFGAGRDGLPLSLQIMARDNAVCLSLAGLLSEC